VPLETLATIDYDLTANKIERNQLLYSLDVSLVMILVLPLSMIGASWGMLVFNKPSCMPSLIGIMLLFGIIIKNSVLLIDLA